MKDIYDFFASFDLHTIIVVGIAFWWINGNIKELEVKFNVRFTELDQKIYGLDQKIYGLDQRVNGISERVARIEGILTSKEYCAVNLEEKK